MESCNEKEEKRTNDVTLKSASTGGIAIVGSGSKSVNQFTIQTLSEIKTAQAVFYFLEDILTEKFLKKIRPDASDMCYLYRDKKDEMSFDVHCSEVCLHHAGKGLDVCLVLSSHTANTTKIPQVIPHRAKARGIATHISPGISYLDSFISDLGLDPIVPGLQQINTKDFLSQKHTPDMHCNVVFWNLNNTNEHEKQCQKLLLIAEKLVKNYGANFEIFHYIASDLPISGPTIEKATLGNILNQDESIFNVTDKSLIYVPANTFKPTNFEMVVRLRFSEGNTPTQFSDLANTSQNDYGDFEIDAINELQNWTLPNSYVRPSVEKFEMTMIDLSLNPATLRNIDINDIPILQSRFENNHELVTKSGENSKSTISKRKRNKNKIELPITLADSDSEYEYIPPDEESSESEEEIQGPRSQHQKKVTDSDGETPMTADEPQEIKDNEDIFNNNSN